MSILGWTYLFVGLTFALYLGIAWITRVRDTTGFYVAGRGVPGIANGMATAADWMSAASFISMAGLVSAMGYAGGVYLMGWTGGYVLLALLLAPYLRKFGHFTVPDFVGDRYECRVARVVAVICAIFISFTYVAGQMRGVGVVFARFLEVDVNVGVFIGVIIVFVYATLGGMKGITWTQVAQYWVLITAFLIPAIAISIKLTGQPMPSIGMGSMLHGESVYLLDKLNQIHADLGFASYTDAFTSAKWSKLNVLCVTVALMVGTAGLPHVIVRFYTVKNVAAARWSAAWALLFIAALYLTAPATAAFARYFMLQTLNDRQYTLPYQAQAEVRPSGNGAIHDYRIVTVKGQPVVHQDDRRIITADDQVYYRIHQGYLEALDANGKLVKHEQVIVSEIPSWFHSWARTGLVMWLDGPEHDGLMQYSAGKDNEIFRAGSLGTADLAALERSHQKWIDTDGREGADGRSVLAAKGLAGPDQDIIVLATPEMAELANWIVAFIAAGGLAAALSTASGLLLVISSSVAHDLYYRMVNPQATEAQRLAVGRAVIGLAVVIAGYFGIRPPGFVSEVVAFAFGLAASSFFPVLVLGIFSRRVGTVPAVAGMVVGVGFTAAYIISNRFFGASAWLFGINAQGIGAVGMVLNFIVTLALTPLFPPPSAAVQQMVESIREPEGVGPAVEIEVAPEH